MMMQFREEANTIFDEKRRALMTYTMVNGVRHIKRLPACTIGEYFAILTWLIERDGQTASE